MAARALPNHEQAAPGRIGEVQNLGIGSVGGMGILYGAMELAAFSLGLTAIFSEIEIPAGGGN